VFRLFRGFPLFRLLAIGQVLLLAWHHLSQLNASERRRMLELLRRPRSLTAADKDELRALVRKLEPAAFAGSAARRMSPVGFPRRFSGARR
jgi:hypothetical protein